jgi:hypothetical protein
VPFTGVWPFPRNAARIAHSGKRGRSPQESADAPCGASHARTRGEPHREAAYARAQDCARYEWLRRTAGNPAREPDASFRARGRGADEGPGGTGPSPCVTRAGTRRPPRAQAPPAQSRDCLPSEAKGEARARRRVRGTFRADAAWHEPAARPGEKTKPRTRHWNVELRTTPRCRSPRVAPAWPVCS